MKVFVKLLKKLFEKKYNKFKYSLLKSIVTFAFIIIILILILLAIY